MFAQAHQFHVAKIVQEHGLTKQAVHKIRDTIIKSSHEWAALLEIIKE